MMNVNWKSMPLALGLSCALPAAAATWSVGDLTNELSVAAGETYTLTADDAAKVGSKCLWVTGPGIVEATKAFTNFTGSVRISNGIFRYREHGGLGVESRKGCTLQIDGGTLENYVQAPNSWAYRRNPSIPCDLTVHLSGTGFEGRGAIVSKCATENFAHYIYLDDDALIAASESEWSMLQFRYATLYMGGHKLSTKGNLRFGIVQLWGGDGYGDIEKVGGGDGLYLSDWTLPFTNSTWTVTDSSVLVDNFGGENTVDNYATIRLVGSTYVSARDGCPKSSVIGTDPKSDRNRFKGNLELTNPNGHVMNFAKDGLGLAFDGVVSGPGGIRASSVSSPSYGLLRLSNSKNSFQGGVATRGKLASDGSFKGGISLLANGAAPTDGGAIALSNAQLRVYNRINQEQAYELPSIVITDGGEVLDGLSRRVANIVFTAKGLTKTGAGIGLLSSPIEFVGPVDVKGGTLRLAPSARGVAGLNYYWQKSTDAEGIIHQPENYQGVDRDVTMAYKGWTNYGSGDEGDDSYRQGYYYDGYICIPGEEGTDVTFNFATCVARYCRVTIDGTLVAEVSDGESNLKGTTYVGTWTRLGIAPTFTMKAGWHKLSIFMANSWNWTCGPIGSKDYNWPGGFGIGVDWTGRRTTNSTDYAKLEDGGNGTLLRWSLDSKPMRAKFSDTVAFAPGSVFDLGDAAGKMSALEIAALAGVPTVMNGALRVAATDWTLRTGDVVPGKPLLVTKGSSLQFGAAGSTVRVDVAADELDALVGKVSDVKILSWQTADERPNNRFVASDALKSAHWSVRTEADGVYLKRSSFFVVIR